MHQVATQESYKAYLSEAKIDRWLRNISAVGGLATTAVINFSEGLTPTDHAILTGFGLAFTAGVTYLFENERRYALHNSRLDAAQASIGAHLAGQEFPVWAVGNAGHLVDAIAKPELAQEQKPLG